MLSAEDYQSLLPYLEFVPTQFNQVLIERGQPIPYVYYPCNSVYSVLASMQDGATVEVGTVGNEGFVGIGVFIGNGAEIATDMTICRMADDSLRMSASDFHDATIGDTPCAGLPHAMFPLTSARSPNPSPATACIPSKNGLGVHRSDVSRVVGIFQQAGIITYKRDLITLLDREALESASCENYGIEKGQFERLLGCRFCSGNCQYEKVIEPPEELCY